MKLMGTPKSKIAQCHNNRSHCSASGRAHSTQVDLLRTACCLLRTPCCPLPAACCPLPAPCSLLPTTFDQLTARPISCASASVAGSALLLLLPLLLLLLLLLCVMCLWCACQYASCRLSTRISPAAVVAQHISSSSNCI